MHMQMMMIDPDHL